MKSVVADFFLGSSEHRGEWSHTRACQVERKVIDNEGREYLWVKIDPPVTGQRYGLGEKNLTDVLLLPHVKGTSLFPISEFPLQVYIYRVLDYEVLKDLFCCSSNLELAAWGEIYASRDDERAREGNVPSDPS
jgi:hypothetical protein